MTKHKRGSGNSRSQHPDVEFGAAGRFPEFTELQDAPNAWNPNEMSSELFINRVPEGGNRPGGEPKNREAKGHK
jgi:hypothetical protein